MRCFVLGLWCLAMLTAMPSTHAQEDAPQIDLRVTQVDIVVKRTLSYMRKPMRAIENTRMTIFAELTSEKPLALAPRQEDRPKAEDKGLKVVTDTGADLRFKNVSFGRSSMAEEPRKRESDGRYVLGTVFFLLDAPPETVKSLKVLSGAVDVYVIESREEITIKDPASKVGTEYEGPFGKAKLEKVEGDNVSLAITLDPEWTGTADEIVFKASPEWGHATTKASSLSAGSNGNQRHITAGFSRPISETGEFVISYPKVIKKASIPFEFRDLPLTGVTKDEAETPDAGLGQPPRNAR